MLDIVTKEIIYKFPGITYPVQRSSHRDLRALVDVIDWIKKSLGKQNIRMAEIGCFGGESSAVFAQSVSELYCIDAWDKTILKNEYEKNRLGNAMEIAENVFNEVCAIYPNIKKNKKESVSATREYSDGFFDFIYIDAEHSYESVKRDLLAWKDKTTKYIGGHDYHHSLPGVVRAVRELFGEPVITFVDTSYICEVK